MTGLRFGQPAPDFTLPSTAGGELTLSTNTSFIEYDKEDWLDPDDSAFAIFNDHRLEDFEQFAQEIAVEQTHQVGRVRAGGRSEKGEVRRDRPRRRGSYHGRWRAPPPIFIQPRQGDCSPGREHGNRKSSMSLPVHCARRLARLH